MSKNKSSNKEDPNNSNLPSEEELDGDRYSEGDSSIESAGLESLDSDERDESPFVKLFEEKEFARDLESSSSFISAESKNEEVKNTSVKPENQTIASKLKQQTQESRAAPKKKQGRWKSFKHTIIFYYFDEGINSIKNGYNKIIDKLWNALKYIPEKLAKKFGFNLDIDEILIKNRKVSYRFNFVKIALDMVALVLFSLTIFVFPELILITFPIILALEIITSVMSHVNRELSRKAREQIVNKYLTQDIKQSKDTISLETETINEPKLKSVDNSINGKLKQLGLPPIDIAKLNYDATFNDVNNVVSGVKTGLGILSNIKYIPLPGIHHAGAIIKVTKDTVDLTLDITDKGFKIINDQIMISFFKEYDAILGAAIAAKNNQHLHTGENKEINDENKMFLLKFSLLNDYQEFLESYYGNLRLGKKISLDQKESLDKIKQSYESEIQKFNEKQKIYRDIKQIEEIFKKDGSKKIPSPDKKIKLKKLDYRQAFQKLENERTSNPKPISVVKEELFKNQLKPMIKAFIKMNNLKKGQDIDFSKIRILTKQIDKLMFEFELLVSKKIFFTLENKQFKINITDNNVNTADNNVNTKENILALNQAIGIISGNVLQEYPNDTKEADKVSGNVPQEYPNDTKEADKVSGNVLQEYPNDTKKADKEINRRVKNFINQILYQSVEKVIEAKYPEKITFNNEDLTMLKAVMDKAEQSNEPIMLVNTTSKRGKIYSTPQKDLLKIYASVIGIYSSEDIGEQKPKESSPDLGFIEDEYIQPNVEKKAKEYTKPIFNEKDDLHDQIKIIESQKQKDYKDYFDDLAIKHNQKLDCVKKFMQSIDIQSSPTQNSSPSKTL